MLSERVMRAVKVMGFTSSFCVGWYLIFEADYSNMEYNQPESRALRRRYRLAGTKEEIDNQDEHCFVPLQRWYRRKVNQTLYGINDDQRYSRSTTSTQQQQQQQPNDNQSKSS